MTAYSLLQTLTQAPIVAKAAQDGGEFGKYVFFTNGTLNYVIPETFAQTAQRLYGIKDVNDDTDKQMPPCWNVVNDRYNFVSRTITEALRDKSVYCDWCSYNKWGVASINDVEYVSKIADNENNNPPQSTDKWARGIKNTDMLPQRFNCWDVSMVGNTISLSSTSAFADYLFTEDQLVNGLKLSFIATTTLNGYSAGSSYTITVDGVSKKLFENANEQEAAIGGVINANELVTVYYNSAADNGNGAFFVVKTGGGQSSGGQIYLPLVNSIEGENGCFLDFYLHQQRHLVAKYSADIIDITGCDELKRGMQSTLNAEAQWDVTQNTKSAICNDDRTWQLLQKYHKVNNPNALICKRRWTGSRTLYAWRQDQEPTDAPANLPNNQFNLPLVPTSNPQPGESPIMVQSAFTPSASAELAFRIEADGQKQRQIMAQAPGAHIDVVPANGALQFDLNGARIYGPLFDNANCSYHVDDYYYAVQECPVVASLQDVVSGYCYNSTDSKYYYRATAQDTWADITSTINFVAELPSASPSIIGNLYVVNDDIGQGDSIQIASWRYSQANIANSLIASFRFADFYQTACPRQTIAPDPADYQYYYEPNGNKYYHYNGSAWVDITSSIILKSSLPAGQNWPSSYNDEDYFVDDTPAQQGDENPRWGQDNSLYVAKVYALTDSNIDVFTIASSLDIQLSTMNVLVKNVSILATYTASNQNWLIKVITTTGSYQVGTYNGTETDAPEYIQGILDDVVRQVLGDVYTFETADSSEVSVYDEQGTWISHDNNLDDKYATISGATMTYNNISYVRDSQHDTDASNYMRVGGLRRKQYGYDDMGANTPQSLPDTPGLYRSSDCAAYAQEGSGSFKIITGSGYTSGTWKGGSSGNKRLSFSQSYVDATYTENASVETSGSQWSIWFVLKRFDLEEEWEGFNAMFSN